MPPFLIKNPWWTVALFSSLGFTSIVDRTVLAMLIQPLERDLGVTDVQAGLLIGPAFAFCYSLCALPIAWAIDYRNRKWITIIGVVLWSISTLLSAFAPNFTVLVALRMGVAIGEAVLNPVAVSIIADLFEPRRRSLPTSVYMTSQSVGGSSSFILVGALVGALTANALGITTLLGDMAPWRATLLLVGVPGILISLVMALTTTEPARMGATLPQAASIDREESLFASKREAVLFYAPFLVSNNLIGMMVMTTAAWFPTYMLRTFDLPLSTVGFMFGTGMLCGALCGTVLIPWLVHRITSGGNVNGLFVVLTGAIPVAAICHALATHAHSPVMAVVMIAIFFGISNGVNALPSTMAGSLAGPRMRARFVATHLLLQSLFCYAIGPALLPIIAREMHGGALGPALFTLACFAFPGSLLILYLARAPYIRALRMRALSLA